MPYTIRYVVEIEERIDATNDEAAERAVRLSNVALQLNALRGMQHVGFISTVVIDDSNGMVVSTKNW